MSYQEKKIANLVHDFEVYVFANAVPKGLGGKPDPQAEYYHKLPTQSIKLNC